MSHQPFETWLLSEEPLNNEQRQLLETHIETCESCRTLAKALTQVEDTLAQHPSPLPKPGFTQRWQTRLAVDAQERQQRKMWFLTLGLFGLAGLIFLTLFVLNIKNVNWIYEISLVIANVSVFASKLNRIFSTMESLINAFPVLIPVLVIFGLGILSTSAALLFTWFSSLIRLYRSPKEGVKVR